MQTVAPASQFFSGAPPNLTLTHGSEFRTQFVADRSPNRIGPSSKRRLSSVIWHLNCQPQALGSHRVFLPGRTVLGLQPAAASARRDVTDVRRFTLPMEAACVINGGSEGCLSQD